jgi:prepilin peptidase CpaA
MSAAIETSLFVGSAYRLLAGAMFTGLLLAACVSDVRSRRIPNFLVAVLAVAGLLFSVLANPVMPGLTYGMSGLAVGFVIWILFYALGVMGAGDVKLFAAAGAWLGPGGAWRASLVAAVAGGVIAVGMLLHQRRLGASLGKLAVAVTSRSRAALGGIGSGEEGRKRNLPYGVALAFGALVMAWAPGLLR